MVGAHDAARHGRHAEGTAVARIQVVPVLARPAARGRHADLAASHRDLALQT